MYLLLSIFSFIKWNFGKVGSDPELILIDYHRIKS